MKVKLENLPQGIFVCHILESLSRAEGEQVIQGITKILADGKSRIIIESSAPAVSSEGGPEFLEKGLRRQKELAQKLGGDVKYVVPENSRQNLPEAIFKYEDAVKIFLGQSEEFLKEIQSYKDEIANLKAENLLLTRKLEELAQNLQKPSSDEDLRAALKHYQKLAAELEMDASPPQKA